MSLRRALNPTVVLRLPTLTSFRTSIRFTSAGPPPVAPPDPTSLRFKWENFLEKWPKVAALNKLVFEGSKWCLNDIKTYIKLRRGLMSGKTSLSTLSTSELEVLVQSGSEIMKMMFLIVVLQIPGPGDVLIALLIFFPRVVLTRHFWTDEQRRKFFAMEIQNSNSIYPELHEILKKPASISEIDLPKVEKLSGDVFNKVCKLQGLYPVPNTQGRLNNRVKLLRLLDETLPSYIDSLTTRQLLFHMYIRRLDYSNLSDQEIRTKLMDWVSMTSSLNNTAYLIAPAYFNTRK